MSKSRVVAAAVLVLSLGCFARRHSGLAYGQAISPPTGLDSLSTAKWVDDQRSACHGRLVVMVDEGGVVRDLDRPVARYHSPLVGVICQRDR
jgi:hypothetical protein